MLYLDKNKIGWLNVWIVVIWSGRNIHNIMCKYSYIEIIDRKLFGMFSYNIMDNISYMVI